MANPPNPSSNIPKHLVKKGLYLPPVSLVMSKLKDEKEHSERVSIIGKTFYFWGIVLEYEYNSGAGSNPSVLRMVRDGMIPCIGSWIISDSLSSEFHKKNGQ